MAANAEVIRSLDREIQFTVFPNAFASSKVDRSLPWSKLVQSLTAPKNIRGSKAECQLLKLATFGDVRTTKNSLRHDANMRQVTGLVGDYDGEIVSVEEAGARLRKHGIEAFFYTSASHTPEKPRWRVLAPLSAPVETAQHYALMAALNGALGGILSTESFTASQTYYFGRVENAAYETLHVAGALCVDDLSVEKVGPTKRERAKHDASDLSDALVYEAVTDETLSDIRSALVHLASKGWADNGNRVKWIKIGQNLAGLGDAGEDLFVEMSKLGDAPDLEDVTRERFTTFGGDRSDYRSVFAAAQAEGWVNPKSIKKDDHKPALAHPEGKKGDMVPFVEGSLFAQGFEDVDWLIEDVIPRAQVGVIYGASGSGKTFFALDLACAIHRGLEWRGKFVEQADAFYVAAEAGNGIKKRIAAYLHQNGEGPLPWFVDYQPNLATVESVHHIVESIKLRVKRPGVIFIDTLALSHDGDENSSKDMSLVLRHCKVLSDATGCLVILVHHTGKNEERGMRGSSALYAGADFVLEISAAGRDHTMIVDKLKDGERGAEFPFTLPSVEVGQTPRGKVITSCYVRESDKSLSQAKKNGRKPLTSQAQIFIFDVFRDALGMSESMTETELVEAVKAKQRAADNAPSQSQSIKGSIAKMIISGHLLKENEDLSLPHSLIQPHSTSFE